MQLKDNWKDVLKRAWSIRFMILAGILTGAEVILPLFSESLPRGPFAVLSFLAVSGAFVSRLLVQKDV